MDKRVLSILLVLSMVIAWGPRATAESSYVSQISDPFNGYEQAYYDYIVENASTRAANGYSTDANYYLIYVDDNTVPELLIRYIGGGNYPLCTYYNGEVNEVVVSNDVVLEYHEKGNAINFKGDRKGCYHDVIYGISDGIFVELGHGFYAYNSPYPTIENGTYQWNGEVVSEGAYKTYLAEIYPEDGAKGISGEFTYEEILECLASGIDSGLKNTAQLRVYAENRDLSLSYGQELWLTCVLEKNGEVEPSWDKFAYAVGNPSVVLITEEKRAEGGYYLLVEGLTAGTTSLTISDADSGQYVMLTITVRDSDAIPSTWNIDEVPHFYPDYLCERNNLTNFYNFNGLYVADFPYANEIVNNNGFYTLSFTVYNSTNMYGSVDVYDAKGDWYDCERIDKHTEITGLVDTAKSALFLVRDFLATDALSYTANSFSTPTKITITVPEGGYFTISNNFFESHGAFVFNCVDLMGVGIASVAKLTIKKDQLELVQERSINQILVNPGTKTTFQLNYGNITKALAKELSEKGFVASAEALVMQSQDLLGEMGVDVVSIIKTVVGSAEDVAMDAFEQCTLPAVAAALKGIFATNKMLDVVFQVKDILRSEDKPYIMLYTPEMGAQLSISGVVAEPDEGVIPVEARLQAFRVANTEALVISDQGLVTSQYELYNICFAKNGEEVQPNGFVTVKIPVPEDYVKDECIVLQQMDDGQWRTVESWITDGVIVFRVDHFCQFALVDRSKVDKNPFVDVFDTNYYYEPVLWAVDNGITMGTGKNTFSPKEICTRAQVVTFLWRAAGEPEPVSGNNPFTDVKENDYFYKAVLWAVENEITVGTSDTTFSPKQTCTRAHVVTFLYRYDGENRVEGAENPFADVKVKDYYYEPVLWAVDNEITVGTSETAFSPKADCSRGQIVTFLYRYANQPDPIPDGAVSLADLTPNEEVGLSWNTGTPKDIFGTDYSNAINYSNIKVWEDPKDGSVGITTVSKYLVNGAYTRVSGTISPTTILSADQDCRLAIQIDGEYIYHSPELRTVSAPVSFDIDITGAQTLRVLVYCSYDAGAIISDLLLWE